jgi:hypothetical protein
VARVSAGKKCIQNFNRKNQFGDVGADFSIIYEGLGYNLPLVSCL